MTLLAAGIDGYALLDSGGGRKLELIAGVRCDRPSPPAVWRPRLPRAEWERATSTVVRTSDGGGYWTHRGAEPAGLRLPWAAPSGHAIPFALRFTSFGHCGLFFEQVPVWRLLHRFLAGAAPRLGRQAKGLNLFGYTGAASLAMAAAGAEVFHVDSAKGVLAWGKESEAAAGLPGRVRWVHEDAMKFLEHSRRKGFRYDAVLADPPSWGHGAAKEVWRFEEQVQALADACRGVLAEGGLLLLTGHTPGLQHQALANVLAAAGCARVVAGEMGVAHRDDARVLPAGVYALAADDPAAAVALAG